MLTKWRLQQHRWKEFHDARVEKLKARKDPDARSIVGAAAKNVLASDGTEIHTQRKARWFYINLDREKRHRLRANAIESILTSSHEVEAGNIQRVPAVDPTYLRQKRMSIVGKS